MAIMTGYLRDFTDASISGLSPRVVFTSVTPGVDGNVVLVDRPIEVTPQSNGRFDVDLKPTATIRPPTYYEVSVKWLDAGGNFIGFNEIPGRLTVPEGGGMIGGNWTDAGGAPGLTWVSLVPPPSPDQFTSWLHMDPAYIDDSDPTVGDYYEWS